MPIPDGGKLAGRLARLLLLVGEGAAIILLSGLLGVVCVRLIRRFATTDPLDTPAAAALAIAVVSSLAVVVLTAGRARLAFGRAWPAALGVRRLAAGPRSVRVADALLILVWPVLQLGWVALVARFAGVPETLPVPAGPQSLVFAAWLVLLAPAAEEVLFRGYFDTRARQLVGSPASFVLTAVLFVASHAGSGAPQLAAVAPLALATGALRRRTGGLWASLLLHALSNAALFVCVLLA